MTTVHVGLPHLRGALSKYASRFDLLEVRPVDTPLPKPSKLRAWRREVPPSFVFSVLLPGSVAALRGGAAADADLARSLEVAAALEARCIVLQTPTEVSPAEIWRRRLAETLAKLPRDVVHVGWEPRGVWEPTEAADLAKRLGIGVVLDAATQPLGRGSVVYTRIRGIGTSMRLSPTATERARRAFAGRREVFAVIECDAPARTAALLRAPLPTGAAVVRPGAGSVVRPTAMLSAEDEEQEE